MAAAAIMGLNKIPKKGNSNPAAMGIPAVLYIMAKKRFCLMFLSVAREITIVSTKPYKE